MRRALIPSLVILAAIALAGAAKGPPPPQLPPCMAISETHMLHVIRVPEFPNIFAARKQISMKRRAKTIIAKLPQAPAVVTAAKPVVKIAKVQAAKKKALRKRVKGCKPGRTRNAKGICGRWG